MGVFENEFKNAPDKDTSAQESFDESSAYLLPKVEIPQFQERDLDTFSDQAKEEALNRRELLIWLEERLLGAGWTDKRLTPLLTEAKKIFEFQIPKWRAVSEWWRVYKKSGFQIVALVSKTENKGNRSNRVQEEEEQFISDAIERWLTLQKPYISSAYQFYCDQVRVHNQSSDIKLPIRHYNVFKERIIALPDYDVLLYRHGKHRANKEFRRRGKSIPQERILQRVEIDHTPLDIILLDDEDLVPLGRPTLTVLVDCYSKCVIGFYLGYNDASYYSVRKAIINAVSPKTYLGDLYTDIEHDWPCQGKIETLVVDNGKEFWSNSLDNACREIGMNVQINPKGSPWLKPLVERFFGTLKDQLIQNIPGHTFPLLKDLENYNPNKHAVMRMGKFVALFHLWVVDVYNRSTDSRGIKVPPNTLWDASFSKLPPVLYQEPELQEFKFKTAMVDERALGKDGIQYENLVYQNNELNEYRKYHYKNHFDDVSGGKRTSRKKEKLLIKIEPDDLSSIHVYLPKYEKYLKVNCLDPEGYTTGLSLHQHKVNLKLHRNFVSSKVDLESLARVRMTIHERIQEEAEFIRSSDKRRSKTNKALAKHSNIGSDNNNTLATSVHNPLPVEDQPSICEQKAVLNSNDWDSAVDDIEAY